MTNIDHVVTMQCSAGKPWVLAFLCMPYRCQFTYATHSPKVHLTMATVLTNGFHALAVQSHGLDMEQHVPWMLDQIGISRIWRPGLILELLSCSSRQCHERCSCSARCWVGGACQIDIHMNARIQFSQAEHCIVTRLVYYTFVLIKLLRINKENSIHVC